jgi:peptide deformylase
LPQTQQLQIIQYPHPTLKRPSKPLRRVDAELHRLISEMFELMYAAEGVGLAANQVDLPYRLFVVNLESDPAAKEQECVFINPVISGRKGMQEQEEGCLSLPGLYGPVKRPEKVTINAYNLAGHEIRGEVNGLLARVIQHETDHLDGVLFIDRLSPTGQLALKQELRDLEQRFARQRERGEIPSDEEIAARLVELEKLRT